MTDREKQIRFYNSDKVFTLLLEEPSKTSIIEYDLDGIIKVLNFPIYYFDKYFKSIILEYAGSKITISREYKKDKK
jgi:hypothetical protein